MPLAVPNRRVPALLVAAVWLAALLLGAALAGPAHAHGDEGVMEVIAAESPAPLQISAEVGVVYANDDDLAVDATVTVTATGPAGETVGPIDVPNRDSAVYATTFEVPSPGTWSLAFSSTEPAAEVSTQVEVLGPEATTTAAPSTAAPTTAGPTTTLAPTSEAAPTTAAGAATTDDEDDGDSNLLAVVAIGVVLAAIVAAVALAARRRATPDPDAPSPAG